MRICLISHNESLVTPYAEVGSVLDVHPLQDNYYGRRRDTKVDLSFIKGRLRWLSEKPHDISETVSERYGYLTQPVNVNDSN